MSKVIQLFNNFHLALRRLKIKSLDLYSYFKSRINRTSHRRRSAHSGSLGGYISFLRNWRRAARISAFLLTLTTMAILFPISFRSATPVEGIAKDPNPSTLSFTASSSSASASLSVTNTAGSSASSSSNASFTLYTNNATGYTLRLKTTGGDTLVDSTNSNTSTNHIDPIGTDGITLDQFSNNTWGLLPSKYNGANNTTNYYKPTTTGFKMDETQAPNTSSNANSYTVGLGIKADYTRPAGTYTNTTIVAEYVANAVTYAIYYYANTTDSTLDNMPSINPQSGVVSDPGLPSPSGDITVNLASAPTRTGYTFKGWCKGTANSSNITPGTGGNADTCNTTVYDAGQSFGINAVDGEGNANYDDIYYLYAMWQRNSYTCTKQYRLENADGTWGSYTADGTESVLYGATCSYSKTVTNYKGSSSAANGAAGSTSGTMGTSGLTLSLDFYRNTFTCSKRYRLQNADGTYPSTYTNATGETILYGATCSYSQSHTDYQTQSTSATITSATTLSLDLPRNTYTLTVSAGTNTSSATGGGTYRWGQTVAVGVTKATNTTCISYATPTWSQSGTAGTFSSTSGASVNFTMGKGAATVTATSTASNISQTVTLSKTNATGITIGGTSYTGTSASLTCGTYNISGSFASGYEFSSWAASGSVSVASTSSASTTLTVNGTGTLTLTGKASCSTITFKTSNASSINFNGTNYSNNGSVCVANGTYWIYGNYASKYAFKSWANTAGSFANSSYQVTQYTVAGNATITLTGQSVGTTIQSITSSTCTTTAKPVYDSRDNEVYWIQKLADGKCWMLDNLRLGSTSTIALTTSNTNSSGNYTLPASGTTCFTTTANCDSSGDSTHTGYTVAAINTASKNSIPSKSGNLTVYGPGTGKIGVYYNYCAAVAGDPNLCVATVPSGTNASADRDICPKGWRMPTGNTSGEYNALYTNSAIGSDASKYRIALSTPMSGYFYNGSTIYQGSDGNFWSSTRSSKTGMYYLYLTSSNVGPTSFSNRNYGNSVRCILK